METNANHVRVEVWGPLAIFIRLEYKTERYSYDCLTSSASRNIPQQIYWHLQMQYQITAIKSYNPIQCLVFARNELDPVMGSANAMSTLAEVEKRGSRTAVRSRPRPAAAALFRVIERRPLWSRVH